MMKKNVWMTIITVITSCCVVGGTIYNLGLGEAHFGAHGSLTSTSSDLEAFSNIKIDASLMGVSITEGDHFSLSCQYTKGLEPAYEVKDGILSIKQRQYRGWGFKINDNQCSLTLTIPEQTAMEVIDVHTAMGGIQLKGITASKCDLLTDMGNCTVEKCSFDEADLDTNMGEVSMSDTDVREAELSSDMGEIQVNVCTFEHMDLSTSMGEVKVDCPQNLDEYDMDLVSSMGSVKVNNNNEGTAYHQKGDAGKLDIDVSMGSIRLNYGKKE